MQGSQTAEIRPSTGLHRWPLVAALGLWAALATRANFLIDDAFISFRYARNWVELGLPAYNPGESPPVEGYSNFLWVYLLRLAYGAGWSLEIASRVVSGIAAAAAIVVLDQGLRRARLGALAHSMGLLALAASAPFAVWTTGGLETSLFTLLLLSSFHVLSGESGPASAHKRGVVAGLLALGLAMTRPEGFLWVIGLALCARMVPNRLGRWKQYLSFGLVLLVGMAGFLGWRWSMHQAWLPNTVYAKASLSSETLGRGLRYAASFALLCPAFGLAVLAAPFAPDRRLAVACFGMLFGGLAYSIAAGGDWMPFFRFLAPVTPFLAMLLALGVQRNPRPMAALAAVATALGVFPIFDQDLAPERLRRALDFRGFQVGFTSEWQRWQVGNQNLERFSLIGRGLGQIGRPGDSITYGAIGAIGWYSNLTIHDRNGLVDREVARLAVSDTTRSAGHDKRVPRAWFIDREPTFYHAATAPLPIPDISSPLFAKVLPQFTRKIFHHDPGEGLLKQHCVPDVYLLEEAPGVPAGTTLLVLRHSDPAAARAYWGE